MVEETKIDAPKTEELKEEVTAKVEAEPKVETKVETKEEDTKVGDIMGSNEVVKESKMVPEAVLLEYKKNNKELKNDIKDLRKLIEDGAPKKEISQELKDIADEHNIDPDFLEKLAKSIKAQTKSELESEMNTKMRPLEEKERLAKIDEAFNKAYERTIKTMPAEYSTIVNKDVIKSLSLNPNNSEKTFAKIIEEAYGHLVKGKKTLETTQTRADQESDIDYKKARIDGEYFKEIMADPVTKAKYNAGLIKRIQQHL